MRRTLQRRLALLFHQRCCHRRSHAAATSEASWHRRARRQRQQARAVLAVERARRTLASHHGGGGRQGDGAAAMPAVSSMLPSWTCGVCGIADNWGTKPRCRNCGAYPPESHRNLVKGGKQGGSGSAGGKSSNSKGKGKGLLSAPTGKGNFASDSNQGNLGTFAFRQLQQARKGTKAQQAQSAYQSSFKELQDARRRNEHLQEQCNKLQRELESKSVNAHGGQDDDDMDEGPAEPTEEERKGRMEKLRNSLPYLEETFGAESSAYLEAAAELDHHRRALRGSKPYKTHRTILERKVDKLRKQQARDRDRLAELRDAADEIQKKITSTTETVAERDKELEAAELELKELLLKAVGEDPSPPQTATDPSKSWDNVVSSVAQLVRAPGVPQEFTSQLECVFNQLRTMVTALQTHATAVGAPQGVAQPALAAATAPQVAGNAEPEATPQLSADAAEQLHGQQAEARRQRQQAAQAVHINRFTANYRAEQAARVAETPMDGELPPTGGLVPAAETAAAIAAAPSAATAAAAGSNDGGGSGRPAEPRPNTGPVAAGGNDGDERRTDATTTTTAATTTAAAAAPAATASASSSTESATAATARLEAGLDEVVVSGGESDADADLTEQEEMQVEALVANLPADKKGGVRALLQVRKARLARKTQRLKKPAADDGHAQRDPKRR